jgi:dephospho-CoA kinase
VTVRIGLTGPIGCGKTTVAAWLGESPKVVVIDADRVARQVVEPGEPTLEAIIERFGEWLRRPDGSLDRAALGRIVFSDAAALAELEAIVHPAVRPRILAAMKRADKDGATAVVVEAVKLIEGGLASLCDEVWLVTCDPIDQLGRVQARGMSAAEADQRIASQGDITERLEPYATRILDTSDTPAATKARVLEAFRDALALEREGA